MFNWAISFIVIAYFATFLYIFFTPDDIQARLVLCLDLFYRVIMAVIYTVTVVKLHRKLKFFPEESMKEEVASIRGQFLSFFLGWLVQAVYEILMIIEPKTSFAFATIKTFITVISFVQPIAHVLWAHHRTFRKVAPHMRKIHNAKQGESQRISDSLTGIVVLDPEPLSVSE